MAQKIEAGVASRIKGFYSWLEKELGDREWFNGDSFGWGDMSVAPFINGAVSQGHVVPAGTKLAAWHEKVNKRPSVAACVKDIADMLSATANPIGDVAELVEKGLFKREYRDHRLEWMIKSGGIEVVLKGLEKDNIRFGPDFS